MVEHATRAYAMTKTATIPGTRDLLLQIGYRESTIPDILSALSALCLEIDFEAIKLAVTSAAEDRDTHRLIDALKELMVRLEQKGYYRPDFPAPLIRLLVNGLDMRGEDIFALLENARMTEAEKQKEREVLASCAAITQLGYILLSGLVPEVRAANAGPHVFTLIDSFSEGSEIFVDFSIESIREIDVERNYGWHDGFYSLTRDAASSLDEETYSFLKEYYACFQVTSGIGLSYTIHNNIGIAYERMGMAEQAIEAFQEALRFNPEYNEVRNNLAVSLSSTGRSDEAVELLNEALRRFPDYAEARSNLGNIFAGRGHYDEAIRELKEAIRLDPGFAGAHNNLGHIHAEQKRSEEAIQEFREAIRLDPHHLLARKNLGTICIEAERYQEAIREFEEVLRLDPESTEAHYGLGLASYRLGRFDRAVHAWARAVFLDPDLLEEVPDAFILKVRQGVLRLKART